MKITTISECRNKVGEQVPCVSGTLAALYDFKSGMGKNKKPWTLQNGVLRDSTGDIKILFSGREEIPAKWKGSKITVLASEKSGKGLMVEENTYNEKTTLQLKVTDCAMIDFGTTHVDNDDALPSDEPSSKATPAEDDDEEAVLEAKLADARKKKAAALKAEAEAKARAVTEAKDPPPINGMDFAAARRRVMQMTNLYLLALRSSRWALEHEGLSLTDIPGAAATIFISSKEDGLVDAMPSKPLDLDSHHEEPAPKALPVANTQEDAEWDADPTSQKNPPENIDQEAPSRWQDVVCHVKPFNGSKLGEMQPQDLEALFHSFRPKLAPGTKNYSMPDLFLISGLKDWKKNLPAGAF